MEHRIAVIGIIVEKYDSVEKLNGLLHDYAEYIVGRMGIPYRRRHVNIISVAVDAPQGVSAIPFASQVSAVWRSAQANNQGMLHRIRALTELRAQHSLSAADLVELQYEVMNLSFQQDVVTKIADKSSNAVQTLIKNQ